MSIASRTWKIETFEQDGSTTVRHVVSEREAASEIYRLMSGDSPERKPVALRRAEALEKIAA